MSREPVAPSRCQPGTYMRTAITEDLHFHGGKNELPTYTPYASLQHPKTVLPPAFTLPANTQDKTLPKSLVKVPKRPPPSAHRTGEHKEPYLTTEHDRRQLSPQPHHLHPSPWRHATRLSSSPSSAAEQPPDPHHHATTAKLSCTQVIFRYARVQAT